MVKCLWCGLALLTIPAAAAPPVVLSAGDYRVTVDPDSRLQVAWRGVDLINYEMLQLIDLDGGWRAVYGYGPAGQSRSGDGQRFQIVTDLPGVIASEKTVTVSAEGVTWELAWRFPAGTAADRNYYFIDLPADRYDSALVRAAQDQAGQAERLGSLPGDLGGFTNLRRVEFHAAELGVIFELTATPPLIWALSDWRTGHQSYRLRLEAPAAEGGDHRVTVRLRAAPSSADRRAELLAEAAAGRERERRQALAAMGLVSRAPLRLDGVQASARGVPVGRPIELDCAVGASFDNPFDPAEVDLTAMITTPSGGQVAMPGFFSRQPRLDPGGRLVGWDEPRWLVRYTPTEPGRHGYQIRLRDRSGEVVSQPGSFSVSEAPDFPGWVRISPTQPTALAFDNGAPFVPIGINLFGFARLGQPYPDWRLGRMLDFASKLADAGGNFLRLRADSWWLAIEGTACSQLGHLGPGYYNQRVCAELDAIYELAEARGLQVMHCFENANAMVNPSVDPGAREAWRRPYAFFLEENGGSCEEATEFWTDPEVARWTRLRLRYSVARWGASPALMSWEFFNELVVRPGHEADTVAWHADMARYLREIDPYDHPITNSLMPKDLARHDPLWRLPEMDLVQYHSYAGRELPTVLHAGATEALARWDKPFFFGEAGIIHEDSSQGQYPYDPEGLHLHNGLWAPIFAGAAGGGAFWFIESYLDPLDLWGKHGVLARWVADLPLTAARIQAVGEVAVTGLPDRWSTAPVARSPRDPYVKAPVDRFVVDPWTGRLSDGEHWQSMAHCGAERRTEPTLVLDCAQPSAALVAVYRSVGNAANRLQIRLNGELVADRPYPASDGAGHARRYVEQYDNWIAEYDDTIEIPLPVGRHALTFAASGKDRIEFTVTLRDYFRFPALVVTGRHTDQTAWLWVRHRQSTAYTLRSGQTWEPAVGATLLVPGLAAGRWQAEWFDPWADRIVASELAETMADGRLALKTPPVTRDLALKLRRQ